MGLSSLTVSVTVCVVVFIFSIVCYYFFFHEDIAPKKSIPRNIPIDERNKKKDIKKKSSQSMKMLKSNTVKGFNAKAALNHATDCKSHPLFWREIGGHVAAATCVSFSHPQHKLVATGSVDGSVRCVRIDELGRPSACEVHTTLDSPPDAMSFTQNAKRLIIASGGNIFFFSISVTQKLRKIEFIKSFPCSLSQIHTLQVLDVEQWMVIVVAGLSSIDKTPAIQAFNPKGKLINEFGQVKRKGRVDSKRQPNPGRALALSSPDDRFIALYGCGESVHILGDGEVGIFEVERDCSGHTVGLKLSFVLAGHTCDVVCFAWNSSGKHMVTCCKDGTWRLWDTSVRFNEVDEPRLFSGHQALPEDLHADHVAILSGDVVAFVCNTTLIHCLHGNGEILYRVDDFVSSSVIDSCASVDGQFMATVVKNCRRVPIWKSSQFEA